MLPWEVAGPLSPGAFSVIHGRGNPGIEWLFRLNNLRVSSDPVLLRILFIACNRPQQYLLRQKRNLLKECLSYCIGSMGGFTVKFRQGRGHFLSLFLFLSLPLPAPLPLSFSFSPTCSCSALSLLLHSLSSSGLNFFH